MKTKLVIWGANAQDERILLALELKTAENKVVIYSFPEKIATEEFSQKMMNEWRDDHPVEFPEGYTEAVTELTIAESMLPEDIKVERSDLIFRAQTEWQFIVLSSKLSDAYKSELEDFKDKIEQLKNYDNKVWEELRGFWDKVQNQVKERNLFKEHADYLRDKTNELFGNLKALRGKLDDEFKQKSQDNYSRFIEMLEGIEKKMGEGMRLQHLFDELKQIQRKFKDTKLTNEHRSKLWEQLDSAFKKVKEKRFGSESTSSGDNSPVDRISSRYNGLLSAIEKMERSIKRDQDDMAFQNKRIASSGGQLEEQIRAAKIKMIEERIRSKEEKLQEMNQTRAELEKRAASLKAKEEKRLERERIEQAKHEAEAKIKEQIKADAAAREDIAEELEKAAESIQQEKKKTETPKAAQSMFNAISETIGESLEDMVDTVRAVTEVASERLEQKLDDLKEHFLGEDKEEQVAEQEDTATAEQPEASVSPAADPVVVPEPVELPKEEEAMDTVIDNINAVADIIAEDSEDRKDTAEKE